MGCPMEGIAGLDRDQVADGNVAKKLHAGILPYPGIRGKWSEGALGMD
jgi:hypothetical protein